MDYELNGLRLYYDERGAGQPGFPFLFLHGFPLHHTMWNPVAKRMSDQRRVLLPDLRGFGRSAAPPAPVSMQRLADDALGLLDHLEIPQAVLVGHSMGGYAALAFAQAYPDRLAGLGLVTSMAAADPPERAQQRRDQADQVLREGIAGLAENMPAKLTADPLIQAPVRSMIQTARPEAVASALLGMAARADMTPFLEGIHVPVVVISGAQDQVIPREKTLDMVGRLPEVEWVELEGSGHMPTLEQPDAVAEALLRLP